MTTRPADSVAAVVGRTDAGPDPLYDAPMLVFVYTAWAAASLWAGDRAGLWVLVGATAVLCVGASTRPRGAAPRSFIVDFATILLFCASAIAGGVLLVGALPG